VTTITIRDDGSDVPESRCSDCDAVYYIYWNRSPLHDGPEYCPFCGDEIRETIVIRDDADST